MANIDTWISSEHIDDWNLFCEWNDVFIHLEHTSGGILMVSCECRKSVKEDIENQKYIGFKPTSRMKALRVLQQHIEEKDLEYADNYRICKVGDVDDEYRYMDAKHKGCCGFYDTEIEIDGEQWMIGCNYGH